MLTAYSRVCIKCEEIRFWREKFLPVRQILIVFQLKLTFFWIEKLLAFQFKTIKRDSILPSFWLRRQSHFSWKSVVFLTHQYVGGCFVSLGGNTEKWLCWVCSWSPYSFFSSCVGNLPREPDINLNLNYYRNHWASSSRGCNRFPT